MTAVGQQTRGVTEPEQPPITAHHVPAARDRPLRSLFTLQLQYCTVLYCTWGVSDTRRRHVLPPRAWWAGGRVNPTSPALFRVSGCFSSLHPASSVCVTTNAAAVWGFAALPCPASSLPCPVMHGRASGQGGEKSLLLLALGFRCSCRLGAWFVSPQPIHGACGERRRIRPARCAGLGTHAREGNGWAGRCRPMDNFVVVSLLLPCGTMLDGRRSPSSRDRIYGVSGGAVTGGRLSLKATSVMLSHLH